MRTLKHHEHKLLRKVDFLQWKNEHNQRELQVRRCLWAPPCDCLFAAHSCVLKPLPLPLLQVMRRYHIQDRDDYSKYNKLCGMVTKLVATLKRLDARDSTRVELTDQLLNK